MSLAETGPAEPRPAETRPAEPRPGALLKPGVAAGQSEAPAKTAPFSLVAFTGFIGVLLCLLLFATLARDVSTQEAIALDSVATPFLHRYASPGLDALMQTATFLGSNTTILPLFLLIAAGLLWWGHRRDALFLAVALAGSVALDGVMKLFFHRPRPRLAWAPVLPDYSFPSGHSMNSLVFLLAISAIVWARFGRRAGIVSVVVAMLLAGLIGVSRIYLGFHYLSDVIGGYMAGLLWLLVVAAAFRAGRDALRRRFARAGQASPGR